MENSDNVYISLQKHLDKQAVGFPATASGVEIRILKEFFTPEQASLALQVNYQPRSVQDIFDSVKHSGVSQEKVKDMLEAMESNGAVAAKERNGAKYYYTLPLLIGMLEWHHHKATPQFGLDFSEYMSGEFGRAYTSTKVSQMRTVPVEKSIPIEHQTTTYDKIRDVINNTEGPIGVNTCMCREGANKRGQPCRVTSRSETCMGFDDWARHFIKAGLGRQVTREEALEIIRQNEADGLVLHPSNSQKIDYICSCCGCCCGVMKGLKHFPKPAEFWAHNFYAVVDTESCTACGTCVDKCQMDAAKIDEQSGYSRINLDRCIGCGNCVAACPSEALSLVKNEKETVPPEDSIGLYKLLAERNS
jgi:Na+-translocating ferredoxin:NAD+ oxidoreductase subunit B